MVLPYSILWLGLFKLINYLDIMQAINELTYCVYYIFYGVILIIIYFICYFITYLWLNYYLSYYYYYYWYAIYFTNFYIFFISTPNSMNIYSNFLIYNYSCYYILFYLLTIHLDCHILLLPYYYYVNFEYWNTKLASTSTF